jgi:hypothetical protein
MAIPFFSFRILELLVGNKMQYWHSVYYPIRFKPGYIKIANYNILICIKPVLNLFYSPALNPHRGPA